MGATFTSSSSTSVTYSSTSSNGGQPHVSGSRHAHHSQTDSSGTRVQSASQTLGQPAVLEERNYDASGRPIAAAPAGGSDRQIQDVSESEADRLYRERMEDEYAKREGGA